MTPRDHEVDDQALEQMRSEMANEIDAYREILTTLEPSTRHRARMERMLVELVREDVQADWKQLSLTARARRVWQRWSAAWREMVDESFAFRLASQGAMALGVGLVLAIVFVDGSRSATAYDTEMVMPQQDAEATLDRTLAAAGRFEPVLEPRLRRHDVVVLIDTEEGNHPWLDAFLRLLEAWAAQGITLREFTFSMAPDTVVDRDTKQPLKLEDLARQTEDLPLVVFSRQLDPLGFRGAAKWLPALEAWPRRAWLDPDPRAPGDLGRYRRRSIWELERHGLVRFYLNGEGVVQMARYLAGDGESRPVNRGQPLAAVEPTGEVGEALRLWALVAALVPDPTWDQLEAIRRHFPEIHGVLPEPQALQHLLTWVNDRTGKSAELSGGRGLAIPKRWQDEWLRKQRQLEKAEPDRASFEGRARRLLLAQLGLEAPEDPMDREVWRFKRAMHEAMLEPHRAAEILTWIEDSPIRHEAIRWLEAELARREDGDGEPLPVGDREVLRELVGRAEGIPLGALATARVPGWRLSLAAVAMGALLAFGVVGRLVEPEVSELGEVEVEKVVVERPAVYELEGPQAADEIQPIMVAMEGGTFEMGGDGFFEHPIHSVEVTSFMISKSEVTVAQYRACVEDGRCDVPRTGSTCNWEVDGRDDHPINCVSWDQAKRYAEWIGARLPTEAEWEYAARSGGLDREYPWGNTEPTCDLAVIVGCGSGTQPVCSRTAGNSEQGLCDLAGNVWEWVEDDWHDDYRGAPVDGSAWVDDPRASVRVRRGGSWGNSPLSARVAYRFRDVPSYRVDALGFRVARSLPSSL